VSDRRAAAAATLARLGVDAEAVAAGTLPEERVTALLASPDAATFVAALGDLPSESVAALLVELESRPGTRPLRKEIRRALYRLRQQGVSTPAARDAEPPAPAPAAASEGFVTHHDGRGDRVLWIVRALPAGGSLLIAAQANEPGGLRDVRAVTTARKRVRAARRQLEEEATLRLVPADWRTVDALLVEAHERAGGGERARDYLRLRAQVTADSPRPPAEPVSSRAPVPGPDEAPVLAADSAVLLEEPELRTWWAEPEAVAPFVDEMAAMAQSPLVVSRAASEDRYRDLFARAGAVFFPPAVLARRLEGVAYVLAETGRVARARAALAVARLLRERPEAAIELPLVRALVERALGARLAENQGDRKDALVMTPAEFLRDRASSRHGHTRG
jgi:hypothetical protein